MHHRARHVADHRRHQIGKGRTQQQYQLPAARLAGQGDKAVRRAQFAMHPLQATLEVFQRRVGDIVRQARRLEVAQRQRGIAMRGIERGARFVDAAAGPVEHHHRRVRTGARRAVQRANQPVHADVFAHHARCGEALHQLAASLAAGGRDGNLGHQRSGGVGVEQLAAVRCHRPLRPQQAHRRHAVVAAAHWRIALQVHAAVACGNEVGLAGPGDVAAAYGARADGHGLAGPQAGDGDAARHVDERIGRDDVKGWGGHHGHAHLPVRVTIMAAVRSLVIGVTFRPFFAAQIFW
ncbi:hypothetical protein D9M72_267770 [compost metagenome]